MAACEDDFSILADDGNQSHHHHSQAHHHHIFPSSRFNAKLQNQGPALNILPVKKHAAGSGGDNPDEHDEYSDAAFCSHGEAKCSPAFDPTNHHIYSAEDEVNNSIFVTEDGDSLGVREQRCQTVGAHNTSYNDKRKDRGDDLSDSIGGDGDGDGDGPAAFFYKKKPNLMPIQATGDYRKDREEWSDSAIGYLLEAYTEKYEQLNRGNLRGRDWEDVATVVSDRCDKQKSSKSVEQCKNKVDNLKKRYKAERQRLSNGSLSVSHWPWFKKMEQIVGSSPPSKPFSDDDKSASGSGPFINSHAKRYAVPTSIYSSSPTNNVRAKLSSNLRWRRVIFKITGETLAGNSRQNVDPKVTTLIAKEIATTTRLGMEVAIVVGGSNFFCSDIWVATAGLDRSTACQIGMMATIMNAMLLQASLEKLGVQTRVQTAFTMQEMAEPYIKRRAIRHLEKGRVVIFAGIGANAGNPLLTTDTAAVLRALEINADMVFKGCNLGNLYNCSMRSSATGGFEQISYREFVARGLNNAMDVTAVHLCEENNIPVVIFDLSEPGNISRALCGDQVGIMIDHAGRAN